MKFSSIALAFNLCQIALSAPIVITRQHTADAVTVTDTYSTATNTVTAPTVEILVSNGVTYTYTLTDAASLAQPTTFTSVVNDNVEPTNAGQTTTLSPTSSPESQPTDNNNNNNNNNNNGGDNSTPTSSSQDSNNNQQSQAPQAPTAAASSIATTSDSGNSQTTSSDEQTSSSTSSTPTSSGGKLGSVPSGIVYSPYNNDGTCKDNDAVKSDLKLIQGTGIKTIRIYGTDCNSITTVLPNAASLGLKVNQGFWISPEGANSIDDAVDAIIKYGQQNSFDVFDYLTIGNEAVQSGFISVSDLVSKIKSVKGKLQGAGYQGKVTTSEPPVTFEENPSLCTEADIDFVGVNPHSYFDKNSKASTAGSFVKGQVDIVAKICGGKDIIVTETGYPHKGNQNGGNIPSPENQKIAIADILDKLDNGVTILSTFDDYWKQPGEYGIEQSFGAIQLFE